MHGSGLNSSKPTKSYSPSGSDDLLPPINFTTRHQTTDTTGWSQKLDADSAVENWHLSPLDDSPSILSPIRRPTSTGLQKLSSFPTMSTFTESDPNNRWRFNGNGQLIDSEAANAGWDLADEIVRLNIGDVGGDVGEDGTLRTPPQSKVAAAAVAQLAEASPLETSSNTSVGSSPPSSDQINLSHSRGPSTDSTLSSSQESAVSNSSNTLLGNAPLKNSSSNELKERPHSFSGGLSTAELRRLQHAGEPAWSDATDTPQQSQHQWAPTQYRDNGAAGGEQLSYPSLVNNNSTPTVQRPPQGPLYDYRGGITQGQPLNRDDLQVDYVAQPRSYSILPQGLNPVQSGPAMSPFIQGRPNPPVPNMQYRPPPPRGFPQQGVIHSPTALSYAGAPQHTSHLSLGNSQQLYDMMLPGPLENAHPAVNRVQQQHNVFPRTHQHSASDPSAIRDQSLAMLNGGLQGFPPGMFPGAIAPPAMPMYPQYYGAQDAYARSDPTAQVMAARLQSQYTGPYGMVAPPIDTNLSSPTTSTGASGQNGPSANNRKLGLYKTELCRSWEEKGTCRYGTKCQFAHGEEELRKVSRHPKYKTEICRTFWVSGSCPYGKRCCFIHTELPPSGAAAAGSASSDVAVPPPPHADGRARSMSTNSDPNEASVSLLQRISAKRGQQDSSTNSSSTPVDVNPNNGFQFGRPPTGTLRVDTSSLDASVAKQNKSAYPSFASNGVLLPASDNGAAKSPAPVTAGPDLGRHNNSRLEIVGYNQRVNKSNTPPSTHNPRHSLNGTEDLSVNFSPSPPVSGHSYTLSSGDVGVHANPARANGHVRAGSAGNWGTFTRGNHLATSSGFPAPSPGEINSPWSTTELAVGSSRLNEKAWA